MTVVFRRMAVLGIVAAETIQGFGWAVSGCGGRNMPKIDGASLNPKKDDAKGVLSGEDNSEIEGDTIGA